MRDHLAKFVIIGLMVLIVGLPFVLRPGDDAQAAVGQDAPRLVIITPHNEQIRHEVAHAFNRWRVDQGLPAVRFDWRASGGTSELRRGILAQYGALAERHAEDQGIGADLFFGGGEYEHVQLTRRLTVERHGEELTIPVSVAPDLPEGLINAAFPNPHIGGERLYHDDQLWIGTTLSSFGIVYNRDVLEVLGVPEPRTWRDMADPRLAGWVALSDPGHSGSIAVTYNTILQRLGWHEGWALLRRSFANARYFTTSSSRVPVDVSAGMCIDFYGRYEAGAVADGRVGYVDPAGLTATTADPISLLRGAPNRQLAEQFIAWLLTPEAQQLWQAARDAPEGMVRPDRYQLRRQPIRQDVYSPDNRRGFTDPQIDPFGEATAMAPDTPNYYGRVAVVSHAMAIDIHDELIAAWRVIRDTPADHPDLPRMLELFDAMPPELTIHWPDEQLATDWRAILEDPDHPRRSEVVAVLEEFQSRLDGASDEDMLRYRVAWTRFFRDNYRQVVELGG